MYSIRVEPSVLRKSRCFQSIPRSRSATMTPRPVTPNWLTAASTPVSVRTRSIARTGDPSAQKTAKAKLKIRAGMLGAEFTGFATVAPFERHVPCSRFPVVFFASISRARPSIVAAGESLRDRSRRLPCPPPHARFLDAPGLDVVAVREPVEQRLRALPPEIRVLLETREDEALELRGQGPAQGRRGGLRGGVEMILDDLERPAGEDGSAGQEGVGDRAESVEVAGPIRGG